ncbi:MAG TPA: hypothetical protein VGK67_30885 [Myxococcales bacterium]|jgi:hypothetical protein
MTTPKIAYLAKGRLHVKDSDAAPRVVESKFGLAVRDRAVRSQNVHSWKTEGRGAQFMMGGAFWGGPRRDPAAMRIAMTSVARAREPGKLLYALETDEVGGLFAVDLAGGEEQRLFHGNSMRVQHPATRPEVELIACSVPQPAGTANLAVMRADGSELLEVTEGDSLDLSPSWVPNQPQLVYQTAGLGRDREGNFLGYGPFALHRIDLKTSEIQPLIEDPATDFLGPRVADDGTIWAIRRPWKTAVVKLSFWRFFLDVLLFPWRLLVAFFQFLNFFVVRYTGKPLSSSGDARQQAADMQKMMVWGNLIDADKNARKSRLKGDEAPDLVPSTWQLVKIPPGEGQQPEVAAKGVLSFDLCADGTIIYSNGSAVFLLGKDGKAERVHKDEQIEQVVALG